MRKSHHIHTFIICLVLAACGRSSTVSPRINHIVVLVTDMDQSEKFYTTAFDLKVANEIDSALFINQEGKKVQQVLNVHFLKFDNQDFVLELVEVDSVKREEESAHIHHFGIDVQDIDKSYERVKAAGAEVLSPIGEVRMKGLAVKHCFFRGPDGEIFELMQILDGDF